MVFCTDQHWLGCIGLTKIADLVRYGVALVEEVHFESFQPMQVDGEAMEVKGVVDCFEVVRVKQQTVAAFLADNSICFQIVDSEHKEIVKLGVEDLGYASTQSIVSMKVTKEGRPGEIVLLLWLRGKGKDMRYVIVEALWE